MSRTSALTHRKDQGTDERARRAPIDRLALLALALEAVPVVAMLAGFVIAGAATNGTVGMLLDMTLLGFPAGFVLGIVAVARLRRAVPPRRGMSLAAVAIAVPPLLFVALLVMVVIALGNLELS